VVDDNSPDGTFELAASYAQRYPWVKAHRRLGERGLSSAVLWGFEQAQGSILGVMDADFSHDEAILPALIQAVEDGAAIAVGSRRIPGGGADHWPWYRHSMSTLATAMAKFSLKVPLSDPMSGYFVLSRALYESCKDRLDPIGYKTLLEIVCKSKPATVKEIPFVFKDRRQGYSKLTVTVIWQYFRMLYSLAWESR
jgi:dolichol-phosphate mannosyltransferase